MLRFLLRWFFLRFVGTIAESWLHLCLIRNMNNVPKCQCERAAPVVHALSRLLNIRLLLPYKAINSWNEKWSARYRIIVHCGAAGCWSRIAPSDGRRRKMTKICQFINEIKLSKPTFNKYVSINISNDMIALKLGHLFAPKTKNKNLFHLLIMAVWPNWLTLCNRIHGDKEKRVRRYHSIIQDGPVWGSSLLRFAWHHHHSTKICWRRHRSHRIG